MDARERLRRYLEQRRELGESELVLDALRVDDVLRIVGLHGAGAARDAARDATAAAAPRPAAPVPDAGAPADHPALRGDAPEAPFDPSPLGSGPVRAFEPEMRDRAGAAPGPAGGDAGDWRAMLRAAGGAPEQQARPAAAPPTEEDDMATKRTGARKRAADEPEGAGMAPSSAPGAAAVPDAGRGQRAAATPAAGANFPGLDVPLGLSVGGGPGALLGGPFDHLDTLEAIARTVHECTRCPLYKTATHGVPGEGNPEADFVVVGEAPGAEEDATGRPFVGASGQLLTKILGAINLAREDVFICNVVKHRPPGNRNPTPDEVEACSPYLVRQLELLRPKVILTVGNFAVQTLLGTKLGISKLRGQVHLYHGIPLVATYHPAALLRNPTWKRPTWEDVQLARRLLDRAATG